MAGSLEGPAVTVEQWGEYLRFREAFEAVLDPELYSIEWLDGQIISGQMRLLSRDNSAIIVSIRVYPTGTKEIHGEIAAGNLETIVSQLIPEAEALGNALGCTRATIQSREGWAKVMKTKGYNLSQTLLEKAL